MLEIEQMKNQNVFYFNLIYLQFSIHHFLIVEEFNNILSVLAVTYFHTQTLTISSSYYY